MSCIVWMVATISAREKPILAAVCVAVVVMQRVFTFPQTQLKGFQIMGGCVPFFYHDRVHHGIGQPFRSKDSKHPLYSGWYTCLEGNTITKVPCRLGSLMCLLPGG